MNRRVILLLCSLWFGQIVALHGATTIKECYYPCSYSGQRIVEEGEWIQVVIHHVRHGAVCNVTLSRVHSTLYMPFWALDTDPSEGGNWSMDHHDTGWFLHQHVISANSSIRIHGPAHSVSAQLSFVVRRVDRSDGEGEEEGGILQMDLICVSSESHSNTRNPSDAEMGLWCFGFSLCITMSAYFYKKRTKESDKT